MDGTHSMWCVLNYNANTISVSGSLVSHMAYDKMAILHNKWHHKRHINDINQRAKVEPRACFPPVFEKKEMKEEEEEERHLPALLGRSIQPDTVDVFTWPNRRFLRCWIKSIFHCGISACSIDGGDDDDDDCIEDIFIALLFLHPGRVLFVVFDWCVVCRWRWWCSKKMCRLSHRLFCLSFFIYFIDIHLFVERWVVVFQQNFFCTANFCCEDRYFGWIWGVFNGTMHFLMWIGFSSLVG